MSNETQILDVLASAGGPLCDDCIMSIVGWNNRQQAHGVGTRLSERSAIIRAHGVCSRCARRKIVNGLPLEAVGPGGSPTTDDPDQQRARIVELLRDGQLDREGIAAEVGVTPAQVNAIKAHVTMGTYDGVEAEDGDAEDLIAVAAVTFGLERDLQNALRLDIEQLESGLRIADGGSERSTAAGRVDITAVDSEGSTVIIELKAGQAAPAALTQLLAYMGAVTEEDKANVRGVLVAGEFHPRILYAAKAIPNVQLRRYRYNFIFEAVE